MILNSRQRHQIEQKRLQGQSIVAALRKEILDSGTTEEEANAQASAFIAPGSTPTRWWADVKFVRDAKRYLKKMVKEQASNE